MNGQPEFKPSQERFELAIKSGGLSENPDADNYVGAYMYMGTWSGVDLFKHGITREYLRLTLGQ